MHANTDLSSRREFLQRTAVAAGTISLAANIGARAQDSAVLRLGLVGTGRRGAGAAKDCLTANEGVELVAIADLFPDQLASGREKLAQLGDRVKVTDETAFSGWDAYKKVIDAGVDLVILAAPPGFRPLHFEYAVGKGKPVFMEKPAAVDPAGVRKILEVSKLAQEKGLSVVAGTQRRHQAPYLDLIKRVHDGAIGDIVAAQCYWVGDYGYYPAVERKPEWSDMEWQIRNWNYFTWLSGDHIVEQHVHNIDVIHWAMQANPIKCFGLGGRQQRTGEEFGHIYDHFAVEFEYPGGVRVQSMCRQNKDTFSRVGENLIGTKGTCDPRRFITGPNAYEIQGDGNNPYEQEHNDWVDSVRNNAPLNEGEAIALSTMAAVMGRMACYSGQEVTWDFAMNESSQDLFPKQEFGELTVPPVAVPGETELA